MAFSRQSAKARKHPAVIVVRHLEGPVERGRDRIVDQADQAGDIARAERHGGARRRAPPRSPLVDDESCCSSLTISIWLGGSRRGDGGKSRRIARHVLLQRSAGSAPAPRATGRPANGRPPSAYPDAASAYRTRVRRAPGHRRSSAARPRAASARGKLRRILVAGERDVHFGRRRRSATS